MKCSPNISELLKYFRFHYFDNNLNNKILIKSEWVSHLPLHLLLYNLGIAENAGWYIYNMIIVKAKILYFVHSPAYGCPLSLANTER